MNSCKHGIGQDGRGLTIPDRNFGIFLRRVMFKSELVEIAIVVLL